MAIFQQPPTELTDAATIQPSAFDVLLVSETFGIVVLLIVIALAYYILETPTN